MIYLQKEFETSLDEDQSDAAPKQQKTVAKATMISLWNGLGSRKAKSPGKLRIWQATRPYFDDRISRTTFAPRNVGDRIVSNASSAPAMPSSQTEK
jgi:hypothetical protein